MSDAAAHVQAAQAARDGGDLYGAAQHQRRAVAMLRGGDALALGHAIRHLAEILLQANEADEAAGPVAEMLALYRGNREVPPLERANALRCAALHAGASGDDETAESFWAAARSGYAMLHIADGVAEADARIAALRR